MTRQRCFARLCNVTVAEPSRAAGGEIRIWYLRRKSKTDDEGRKGTRERRIDTRMEITEEGEVYVKTGGADNNA